MNNMTRRTSRLPGFYRLGVAQRRQLLVDRGLLDGAHAGALAHPEQGLPEHVADKMIENVIGRFSLPVGVGANFLINGREYLVPMVVEEPSIVAAVSHAANIVRGAGGFWAQADRSITTGQIQVFGLHDLDAAESALLAAREDLLAFANAMQPSMVERGGGAVELEVRRLGTQGPPSRFRPMLAVHIHVDACDAMGANLVNTLVEGLAERVEALTGGTVGLRILTNLADRRRVRAGCRIPFELLRWQEFDGPTVARGVVMASEFAECDPWRATTHNKGILNGVDAVAVATGQDWRAIEAGAHAFASLDGSYRPLALWHIEEDHLVGELDMPMAVGTVGGPIRLHPGVQACLALLDVHSARELACVMGAVGLAQNLAAIKALGSTGIQRGHMALHARSVAATAGARDAEVERVAAEMVRTGNIRLEFARKVLDDLRGPTPSPCA
jgi:hydroxymethylglutaryl-CoA reductase